MKDLICLCCVVQTSIENGMCVVQISEITQDIGKAKYTLSLLNGNTLLIVDNELNLKCVSNNFTITCW